MLILKRLATALYIVVLLIAAGIGIGSAAREHMLIPVALPFAVVLIVAARILGRKAEVACKPSPALFPVGLNFAIMSR